MNIEKFIQERQVWEYACISTEQIPFTDDVREACKANLCGRYGACWTCPPGVGEVTELREKLLQYPKAVVFSCKYDLEDSFDVEGMEAAGNSARQKLQEMLDTLRENGEDVMGLGCGSCSICEKCTYPDNPCRFPEKALVSVEACGINVVLLSRKIGMRYHNGADTVTYFSIILYKES